MLQRVIKDIITRMGYRSLRSLVQNADDLLKMPMEALAPDVLLTHLKSRQGMLRPRMIIEENHLARENLDVEVLRPSACSW